MGHAQKATISINPVTALTFIDTHDYDGRYLTWATNGFGGFMKLVEGKFSINADRGIMLPKTDQIDIDYVKWVLQPRLRELAKGRMGDRGKNEFTKVNLSMMEEVKIPIPINEDNNFNLQKQSEIAKEYQNIDDLKQELAGRLEMLSQLQVSLG